MQPGDLVRITRGSIGVPKDTVGLIVKARVHRNDLVDSEVYTLFHVQLLCMPARSMNGVVRRYLAQDLRKLK